MGLNLPKYNAGGSAPNVPDGLVLLRFDDLQREQHPDWAGTDKFGKADDGQRFRFMFTLVDDDRAVVYGEDADPIELDKLTRTSTGEKSNFFQTLRGMMTTGEIAAYQAAVSSDQFDGSMLPGRIVHAKITHNEKGWPQIEDVIGIAAPKKAK